MKHLQLFLAVIMACGAAIPTKAGTRNDFILAQAAPPEICTEIYQPVCGTNQNGKQVTYSNACFARVAKATNVTPGACSK